MGRPQRLKAKPRSVKRLDGKTAARPANAGRATQTRVMRVTFHMAFLPPKLTPTMIGMNVNALPLVLMFM